MVVTEIKELLSNNIGKKEVDVLSNILLHQRKDFETVFSWIFSDNSKLAWHSAWVIEKVAIKDKNFLNNEEKRNIETLSLTNQHDGLQRLLLSILYHCKMEKPISIAFVDKCIEQMIDYKCTIAVQALSMKLLYRISQIEPDFKTELLVYLENCEDENYSVGFNASKRNILKKLNRQN